MIGGTDHAPADDRGRAARDADRRLRGGKAEAVDELGLLVGPQEQVHRGEPAPQSVAFGFPHGATGQDDPHPGPRGFQPLELTLPADHFLLGRLANRAGVDHDEIRVVH